MSSPANPGSLEYTVNDWWFRIWPDGDLTGHNMSTTAAPEEDEIGLSAEQLFAIATLLRMPGVRALINRNELAWQHERHMADALLAEADARKEADDAQA